MTAKPSSIRTTRIGLWPVTPRQLLRYHPDRRFRFQPVDEVKELNEKAEPSVLLGFTLDTTSIADELANCIQIAERYKGELLTGTADPEVMVPQMMKELRAAGFDKIVAEAQSQVDAFMATNK